MQNFKAHNPEVRILTPLIDAGLGKDECFAIIQRAGLRLPVSYHHGFDNANCIGCVNAQSPSYWNRTRRIYPEVFARRAVLSRQLGVRLVKLTKGTRERIYLDDLPPDDNSDDGRPMAECSIMCSLAETDIKHPLTPTVRQVMQDALRASVKIVED